MSVVPVSVGGGGGLALFSSSCGGTCSSVSLCSVVAVVLVVVGVVGCGVWVCLMFRGWVVVGVSDVVVVEWVGSVGVYRGMGG